jgi:hypothetical protein
MTANKAYSMEKQNSELGAVVRKGMGILALTLCLAACGGGGSNGSLEEPDTPPSVERNVYATATDSAISATPEGGEATHVVINPSADVTSRETLLVFLPGTKGQPSQYRYFLRAAAARGFHAVGINYPNQTAMGALCQTSTDIDCHWKARNVVVFGGGTPVPDQSPVTIADSINNRVARLLSYMDAQYPDEAWGQFLMGDSTVDWSKVIAAGHSQGGGHAGVLAKTVSLARVVYFSSPEDWNDINDLPASWTADRPNVTPASLQFGFGADLDTLVPNAHAFAHWDAIGLARPPDGPVLADGGGTLSGSHQLRTASSFNPSSSALTLALKRHGITVNDTSTPVIMDDKPLFDQNGTWGYLGFQ